MSDRVSILQQDLRSGGAERMMLNLAREWTARGVATDLVLVQRCGVYLPVVPPQVRVVRVRFGDVIAHPSRTAFTSSAWPGRRPAQASSALALDVVARLITARPARVINATSEELGNGGPWRNAAARSDRVAALRVVLALATAHAPPLRSLRSLRSPR